MKDKEEVECEISPEKRQETSVKRREEGDADKNYNDTALHPDGLDNTNNDTGTALNDDRTVALST